MLVPKNVQYCTLNCERRQISKCLDVMEKKIPHRSSNNLQIKHHLTDVYNASVNYDIPNTHKNNLHMVLYKMD